MFIAQHPILVGTLCITLIQLNLFAIENTKTPFQRQYGDFLWLLLLLVMTVVLAGNLGARYQAAQPKPETPKKTN